MKKNVLYIAHKQAQTKVDIKVEERYPGMVVHSMGIYENKRLNRSSFDGLDYIEKASDYILKHNIDGVYFNNDLGSIFGAILCQRFGFPGPSLEAAFTCYHKGYTRKMLDDGFTSELIHLNQFQPKEKDFPFYLKAPYSCLGMLGFTIQNEQQYSKAKQIIDRELPQMNRDIKKVFEKYLDLNKYPFSITDCMVKERVNKNKQVTVEGYVHKGEVVIVTIVDTNFYPQTRLIDNFAVPSHYSKKLQNKLKTRAGADVAALKIDNTMFNIEYWVDEQTNVVDLIEVNCRASWEFVRLYRQAMCYDALKIGLDICLGIKPTVSVQPDIHGAQFNIITTKEVTNSSDVFDYTFDHPQDLRLEYQPGSKIVHLSEHGVVLGQFNIYGSSYENIKSQADEYRQKVVKQ